MDSFSKSSFSSSSSARDSSSSSCSPFDSIIFDLDETLYSSHLGIGEATKRNIDEFLVEKFGFHESKASCLRIKLFKTYGSSLAGLRALGYEIDADDYHGFVHGRLPYHLIKPDPQLRNLLLSIKQRRIIFTNSDRIHAIKVLDRLGIKDCFEQMICFETMNPNLSRSPNEIPVVLKPSPEAMSIAINVANVDPCRTLFLDDSVRNVAAGKAVGLRTVLVGKATKSKEADYALETITNIVQVIPEIWWVSAEKDESSKRIGRTNKSETNAALASTLVGA